MSRILMTLLGRPRDKMLEIAFDDLEKATGHKAIDAKLIGDMLHCAHTIIREMELDADATPRELYHALRVHEDLLDNSTSYTGLVVDGEVISFHHDDIATDHIESRQFAQRSLTHLREGLAREISSRYEEWAVHPRLLAEIIKHVEPQIKEKV